MSSYLEAIRQAQFDAMDTDATVMLYGEDVESPFGGAFKATKGLSETFGDRVRNAPISEDAIVGAAIGAALAGMKPIIEFQFSDFATVGFNQLVNHAATTFWRTGHACPIVARLPVGGTPGGGPFHSQMPEAWLSNHPGMVLVAPATVSDAYHMLRQSIDLSDPVAFLEHKHLYFHLKDADFSVESAKNEALDLPLTSAAIRRQGSDCTVVAYSAMVQGALAAAHSLAAEGIECEVVDVRCLKPLDLPTILASLARTGRLVVASEGWGFGSVAAEIIAAVSQNGFHLLDAPPVRVHARETPIPYHPNLWLEHRPSERDLAQAIKQTVSF